MLAARSTVIQLFVEPFQHQQDLVCAHVLSWVSVLMFFLGYLKGPEAHLGCVKTGGPNK